MDKPKVKLVGTDGNVFALMGRCQRGLRDAGMNDKAKEMCDRITKTAESYEQALVIMCEYVDAY